MSKNYLFSLTITPIQSFIAQAKTTKDFYSGSQIISNLIQELLKQFPCKDDIIFPASNSIISNKIIARIAIEKQEELIEKLQKTMKAFLPLKALCNGMELKSKSPELQQLENVFQLFYSSVEITGYKESYFEVEKNLSIIKNMRLFNQISSKNICYVCGERESFCQDKNEKNRCTVCYTKSRYESESYLSTAGIASLYYRQKLDNTLYERYKENFYHFDEALLYEENLKEDYLKKHHHLNNKNIEEIKKQLQSLSKEKPTKQYVLINFDGDNIGKILSNGLDNIGKILSNGLDNIELETFHREFSTKLSTFSQAVNKIISDEKGRVIYSGGDDFLCFVTPYYLNEVLDQIKESFENNVNTYQEKISYSIAITISHYKAPLHKIIENSRALLKATKAKYSSKSKLIKGGIGIEVYSSSSLLAKFIGDYNEFTLLKQFDGKKINLYSLEQLFSFAKSDMQYSEYLLIINMIKLELKRFLGRREIGFSDDEVAKIQQLLIAQVNRNYSIDLDNFFGFFKTVEQLSKDNNE
ncbi:MAG: hypothetical protein KU38_04440 [Sulfurovum sp. FS08-3]|nr:MAG: hypothetical protein KU38_04440 [Sulfurovum sp. FS08-3]